MSFGNISNGGNNNQNQPKGSVFSGDTLLIIVGVVFFLVGTGILAFFKLEEGNFLLWGQYVLAAIGVVCIFLGIRRINKSRSREF